MREREEFEGGKKKLPMIKQIKQSFRGVHVSARGAPGPGILPSTIAMPSFLNLTFKVCSLLCTTYPPAGVTNLAGRLIRAS